MCIYLLSFIVFYFINWYLCGPSEGSGTAGEVGQSGTGRTGGTPMLYDERRLQATTTGKSLARIIGTSRGSRQGL